MLVHLTTLPPHTKLAMHTHTVEAGVLQADGAELVPVPVLVPVLVGAG